MNYFVNISQKQFLLDNQKIIVQFSRIISVNMMV